MFYSHNIENDKIGLFTSFVKSTIEDRKEYKPVVDNVIEEARALASGEKNLYTISRDTFPIVVLLEERDSEYFKGINCKSIDKSVYQKVLDLLSEQRVTNFA